jgi:hypothetical protein
MAMKIRYCDTLSLNPGVLMTGYTYSQGENNGNKALRREFVLLDNRG